MPETVKLLIVTDHPVVAVGLMNQLWMETGVEIVGSAKTPLDALEKSVNLSPDVVLMDVTTGSLDWQGNIASLRTVLPNVRVIAYSLSKSQRELANAEEAGAETFTANIFSVDEVMNAIKISVYV
jgi:two-component system, NarL family, response regulator NreC